MRSLVTALAAVAALHLALALPSHPGALRPGALAVVQLELPLIVLALVLLRGPAARLLRVAVTAALTLIVLVKLADLAAQVAFGRPSNPVFDLPLVVAGARLAHGALGAAATLAIGLGIAAVVVGLAFGLWRATGRLAAIEAPRALRLPGLAAAAVAAGLVAADLMRAATGFDPPGTAFTTRLAAAHAGRALRAPGDLAAFRAAAASDPAREGGDILAALRGRDVFVIFVESYGRFALEDSGVAATIRPTLAEFEPALAAAGLAARSGHVASPVVGGRSWLAHATMLAGLEIDDQSRYRALLASERQTLVRLAGAAGWRKVAVMPAITLAWPEAAWFGYDRILAAGDLGYRGPPFGWMTMPDQFALAAFERAELAATDRPPVLAVAALISSHAPWTPVPRILPWEALGDGAVFAPDAAAGPAPEAIWRDPVLVRGQYARAIDYSLRAALGFAARRGESGPLVVILGDHQPAPIVTGGDVGRDVPVHVIGPPALVDRLAGWDWAEGLLPEPQAPGMAMAELRDRLIAAFTAEPAALVSEK